MKLSFSLQTTEGETDDIAARVELRKAVSKLAELRFDGIELLPYDCAKLGARETSDLIKSYDLELSAVGTGILYVKRGLSLTDPDRNVRDSAIKAVTEFADFAQKCDSSILIIGLIRGKAPKNIPTERFLELLQQSIESCARVAADKGLMLAVEPINRYETNMINTVEEALKLIDQISYDNVKIMVDTFHMNIEERDIDEAILKAHDKIAHVHLADSNRLAPGLGHIDFRKVVDSLKRIDYRRYLSAEVMLKPSFEEAVDIASRNVRKILGKLGKKRRKEAHETR
jgi:sugar phosphate isomerase/epimerase